MARQRLETRLRRVRRIVEIRENRCTWCNRWFETKRRDACYCPESVRACRQMAYRDRRREAESA